MEKTQQPQPQQNIESKDFRIILADGTRPEYRANDEIEYMWAPTQSGCMLIYRKTKHAVFGATLKDERILMLNANEWIRVEIIEDE